VKIGLIFECGPQGADKQVCEYLAGKLRPQATLESRTLDNKANLLASAGVVAATMLADGCERVLIVWDLRPAWPEKRNKPCRRNERLALLDSLAQAGVAGKPVFLICIEQELESWILADETKISAYLSTEAHAYKAPRTAKPDRVPQPKAKLMNHFKAARNWRYEDRVHAIKIVREGEPDWRKLRRSDSFARFEAKLI
jgi:hypothetical protein